MVATFITSIGSMDNVTRAQKPRFIVGQPFEIHLRGVYGRVSWSADNDEVLNIEDDGGFVAKVTAAAVGLSVMTIRSGRDQLDIPIEVYEEPTVSVEQSFGNLRDRQE